MALVQGVVYDYNRHVWDILFEKLSPAVALGLVQEIPFATAVCLTKCSALLLISRLRGLPRDWPCLIALNVISVQGVMFCFLCIFQCKLVLLLGAPDHTDC
jgi:hypothetical protein